MKAHVTTMVLCAMLCAPAAALGAEEPAQTGRTPHSAKRLGERLRDGIRVGDLTRGEARRLRGRIGQLRSHAALLRAGGLTPDERQQLRRRGQAVSQQVMRLRHNDVRRGGR